MSQRTILKDTISRVVRIAIPNHDKGYSQVFSILDREGKFDNRLSLRIILAVLEYLDKKEQTEVKENEELPTKIEEKPPVETTNTTAQNTPADL